MSRRLVSLLAGFSLALITTGASRAAEVVRLVEWYEPAILNRHIGPGLEFFELVARAEWARGVTGRYSLRILLPDGQVDTQPVVGDNGPGSRRLTVYIRASAVRNLRPSAVVVRVSVIDEASYAEVSNALTAGIADFPHPRPEGTVLDRGPFGWGAPLEGAAGEPRHLPRPGLDGWRFVRVPGVGDEPGFCITTTEATNRQVARRLVGYDPRAGRSDEFALEDPAQPAPGLSPRQANAYLAALSQADPSGVSYRLPTRDEWLRAARAGRSSAFWWGDEPSHPAGANFLGPEPALPTDTTAPSDPGGSSPRFEPNPWGLFHTFGNLAEWATTPKSGDFVRLGGHFRTEPQSPLPEPTFADDGTTGPDPYVGVRPAFTLEAAQGTELVRRALQADPRLGAVRATFDPDRAAATLTGTVPEASLRRAADERLRPLWFLAAVEDRIKSPTLAPGQLAILGEAAGPVRRITPLGRWVYEVPLGVRWGDPLPVSGSDWHVNVYLPGGGHFAHRMVESQPDRSKRITVLIDRDRMIAAGLAVDTPVSVALSLGGEAPNPADPRVVTNVVPLRWSLLGRSDAR